MDSVVQLPGQRVCRVMSCNEKKGRFTVENLNHVRCALISDREKLGLLELATTSAHYEDEGKVGEAVLTLNMKEPRRKTSEDTYVMEVLETHIDDCDSFNFGDPHVIICALCTAEKSNAMDRINAIRNKVKTHEWLCPVIIVAYHSENAGAVPYDIMHELREMSKNPRIFRCMEATALSRNLLRHCLAMALFAARPFLAETKAEKDFCINDGVDRRPRRLQSEDRPVKSASARGKPSFRKSCRIQ